ncbi:uncharacterized protein E0L32_011238 [Thyridium curvatum]|uniref:Calcineurin-like phosphoesterase domain-containing protein n=1 Tax=Thyridium curvatum TaxID=1093900 RepID=A0A507BGI1_9PEZI|nr:uncharacterized protein E0L32_011238 [Thyridium curvatum]TPX19077.1 hypothetical protein E0L32_011238 [Thyridium curvatum]
MKAFIKSLLSPPEEPVTPRVQILSDLHLEISKQYTTYTFPVTAPFLLLAGDIGCLDHYDAYLAFLQAQVARYRRVFLVLGNHEFYGLSYEKGVAEAQRLAAEPSIAASFTLLHRTRWDDPSSPLTILGCTLWSAVSPEQADRVRLAVSDFARIGGGWSVERHNAAHAAEARWLREQVAVLGVVPPQGQPPRRILVATHHAPFLEGSAAPQYRDSVFSSAFATDLVSARARQQWRGVRVWAFGHTHHTVDMVQGGIRVVANQRGYVFPGEKPRRRSTAEKLSAKQAVEFNSGFAVSL